jgi:hypothetical protein
MASFRADEYEITVHKTPRGLVIRNITCYGEKYRDPSNEIKHQCYRRAGAILKND